MSAPKDGYYIADVQLDTGGTVPEYVHVNLGKPHNEWNEELLPEACSNFQEVNTTLMVWVWPQNAAMELDALRTANAGLVKEVRQMSDLRERAEDRARRLEEALDTLEVRGDQMNDELYPPDSNCSCHISPPCNDCTDWASVRLAKRDWEEAKQKAAKAKGQP